jgi:hypothetical protein
MYTGSLHGVQRIEVGFIGEPPVLRVLQAVWALWSQIQANNCLEFSIVFLFYFYLFQICLFYFISPS